MQQQRTKVVDDRNSRYEQENTGSESIKTNSNDHGHLTKHKDSTIVVTARTWDVDRNDINVSAQFTAALAGIKNFVVMDPAAIQLNGSGRYSTKLAAGVKGPFVVKAIVTEQVYDVDGNNSRIRVPGLVSSSNSEIEGVVVLDITVLDGSTGALVTAFSSEGTFMSKDKKSSVGLVVPFSERRSFARSVLSQAQRVALNEAAKRIYAALQEYSA